MPVVYLIPSILSEEGILAIPAYVTDAVKNCRVFFAENERTTRRYFKRLWKEMVIDDYEWYTIGKDTEEIFRAKLKEEKNIGIISEAGLPGVADPGQTLVEIAHEKGATVKPLSGPSSVLLALMASGMNGQQFQFSGYLPVDPAQRAKAIRDLEAESIRKRCTQIFIETPYRNNQLLEALVRHGKPDTRLCIAKDLTGTGEFIQTKKIADWKKALPDLHKQPCIFLLLAQG